MSERSVRILLEGMIESIKAISAYTADINLEQFLADGKTRDAVLMQLMVLGETAARVPADFRKVLPEIEWGRIVRSRNIIAHDYQGIDYEIIWRIVTIYLPPLKESLSIKLSEYLF
jgi:uncharacterized protein with HEPN domain